MMIYVEKKFLSVILIILFAHVVYNAKCPGKLGIPCRNSRKCNRLPQVERCYRDLDDTPNATLFYCCRMMCPHTKMIMFHTQLGDTFLHKMDGTLKKELYYTYANSSIACPYPYSHATVKVNKVLPVGFSVNSTAPSNCETNAECGEGSYCGRTINPSANYAVGDVTQVDMTAGGFALRFCYEDPNFGKQFSIPFIASVAGLPICDKDTECLGSYEICHHYGPSEPSLYNIEWTIGRGICVKAYPYSHATIEIDKVLPVGFSVNSTASLKNCTSNVDCGEGFYCGNTVNPLLHGAPINITQRDKSVKGLAIKFCYKDPDFGKKFGVAFNSSNVGLPLCNKDFECLGSYEICYQYGESNYSLKTPDELKWRGICVKAFPYSHATIEIDKVLPVGFSFDSTVSLMNCTINGDCGMGFYCGDTVNPLLHGAPINITQLDKSDEELAIKFCYKDPDFGKQFSVAFNVAKIGLPICNKDSDCLGAYEICNQYSESDDSLNAADKSQGRGICINAYPYSHAIINIDKVLPVGFSVNSTASLKNCTSNVDCGEGFYCGNTVNPLLHGEPVNTTQRDKSDDGFTMKFCYKDPEFGKKFGVAFNATRIGLPLCNKDLECLEMGAICYQYGESEVSLNAENESKGNGICVKALLCDNVDELNNGIAVFTRNGTYCTNEDDCSGIQDEVYHPQCVSLDDENTANGSLCCFTPRMCEHGTARTPRVSCSSSSDCNIATTGPWNSWCDQKGYCCHDTNGTVQHLCPDGATLMFNEPRCESTCENGTCINGRCCPGLVIEDGEAKLGISPYTTKMPCDPSVPLPDYVRFSYCSSDGFVTVIGSNDAFGEQFLLNGQKECKTNMDCEQEGDMVLCIRGNSTSSSCNKDPFNLKETSSLLTTIIVCIAVIVVILVASIIAIVFAWRKASSLGFSLLGGIVPPIRYDNLFVAKTDWKKCSSLKNPPSSKVKCYYDNAILLF